MGQGNLAWPLQDWIAWRIGKGCLPLALQSLQALAKLRRFLPASARGQRLPAHSLAPPHSITLTRRRPPTWPARRSP